MNSDPNELVSIPPCFLEDQYIGALFKKIINPVRDQRVTSSPAWSESTYALDVKPVPRGSGALGGRSSLDLL